MKNHFIQSFLAGALIGLSHAVLAFSGAPSVIATDNTAIANHQQSWEFKALAHQNMLDNATPMSQGFNVMGHNAYNSSAYSSLVHIDPNHKLTITELLDLGVRIIELDYHWVWQTKDLPGGSALLMCHAGDDDFGCSGLERYLKDGVNEVNNWIRKNPKEVVVLYFQDDAEGHDAELVSAVSSINDLIYKQPAGECNNFSSMVQTTSEEDVLKADKQIVIMGSSCSGRGPWTGYSWNSIHNWVSGGGQSILDKSEADCLADVSKQDGAHRIWEDMTNLGRTFGDPGPKIDAALAAKAGRCGITALSLDMISIGDSRMKASIWSWGELQPNNYNNAEDCALSMADGRFDDWACGAYHPYACKTEGGKQWAISQQAGTHSIDAGQAACQTLGSQWQFAVPTNSQQNEILKAAKASSNATYAWLDYSDVVEEGVWKTSKHEVDYGDGTVSLNALKSGLTYEFYMKATRNNCELQWQGGDEGTGERNAKFDCMAKGDPMFFSADSAPTTNSDGSVSIHGVIKTRAGGHVCGLEWDGSISSDGAGGERNAKFDCSGSSDPLTIISYPGGSTERVRITSDNNCGLQWAGGDADSDGERNAKFDCGPAWDDMTLYGVKLPSEYRELKVLGKCIDVAPSNFSSGANAYLWDCHGAAWQKWFHEPGTGLIRSKHNPNFCLDSTNGNEDFTNVSIWACENHPNLQWDVVGDTIRPRKNHVLALDIMYGSTDNGANLQLYKADGNAAQQFSFGSN